MASYLDSTGVTSLTSDIKALTDAAYPANATIINGYSSSSAYSVGDFCIHGGLFYKCNTAIASGGETWNSSHWTQTNVTSEWGTKMVVLSYGNNTWADFEAAFNANAIVYCRASSNSNPGTGNQGRMAFMAFVNYSNNTLTNVEFQYYRSVSSHSASQQGDQVFIYKLEKTNGGTWSVTVRESYTKIVAGAGLGSSYSSGTLTLTGTIPKSTVTLTAANWTGSGPYTQTVTITGGTSKSKIDIQLTPAQLTQLVSDGVFGLMIENNNGTFTAYALGAAPTTNMTVQITRTETS